MKVGEKYNTRNGYNAHIIWKCNKQKENHDIFYAILTCDVIESKPVCYMDNGKFYSWTTITNVDNKFDIILE